MPYQTTRKTRVLLTGFGPFPGVPVNASAELARELAEAANRAFPGVEVVAAYLPTEWAEGRSELRGLLKRLAPDIALHFGVSERARGFEIEARAKNRCEASLDDSGQMIEAGELEADAPDQHLAGIGARRVVENLRQAGLPAFLSRDAGGYLCNAVFYHSLTLANMASAEGSAGHQAGFIHIPVSLADARRWPHRPATPLSWRQAMQGGLIILATCLGTKARIPST